MNPWMLFSPSLHFTAAQRAVRALPAFTRPRALVGSLLLAAAMAGAALAPPAQAQGQLEAEAEPRQEPAVQELKVNINTADAQSLSERLTGIGRSRAEAIVRYRETYGPFESIDELMDVSGIGEATLARNRAAITLE